MTATALQLNWQKLRLAQTDFVRMLAAGTAWGTALTAGLAGLTFWNCGMICPDDIAITAAISSVAGILAIGPIAAYGRR